MSLKRNVICTVASLYLIKIKLHYNILKVACQNTELCVIFFKHIHDQPYHNPAENSLYILRSSNPTAATAHSSSSPLMVFLFSF